MFAKLGDFGHVKLVEKDLKQDPSYPIYSAGMINMQSPEQQRGVCDGKKNDMWLLGLLVMQMFHGNKARKDFLVRCGRIQFPDPKLTPNCSPNSNENCQRAFCIDKVMLKTLVPEDRRCSAAWLLENLDFREKQAFLDKCKMTREGYWGLGVNED